MVHLWLVNQVIGSALDMVLSPFRLRSPLWSLSLLAVLSGFFMVVVYRFASNQQGIRQTKNRLKAHVLEIFLFKHDLAAMVTAQKQMLLYNVVYMKHAVKPMAIMIGPMALLLLQLDNWFGYRPLQPDETAVVTVRVTDQMLPALDSLVLDTNQGIVVETPRLWRPEEREADWRIRALVFGTHELRVQVAGHTVRKTVEVSDSLVHVSRRKVLDRWWDILWYPGERPIPTHSGVEQVQVGYPARSMAIFGWHMHWFVVFFLLSVLCGFVWKSLIRVEI